jgi:orotate phosphoribosyltransferase
MTETLRGSSVVRSLVAQYAYTRQTTLLTLSSGATSYDYIDGKQILLVNEFQAPIGREIARVIAERGVTYAGVGGLELGAIYVAQALLMHEWIERKERLASFVVRKKQKKHGKGLKIEGPSVEGLPLVVVDDVVTTGDSIIKAVDAVRAEGAEIVLAVTLVDRGDIASGRLKEIGVPYHPLTTYRDYGIDPVIVPDMPPIPQLAELKELQLPRADRLLDLSAWCWDTSDNTGDARFAGIARTLEEISEAWDVKNGLPEAVIRELNTLLANNLAEILSMPDAADASDHARRMRNEIRRAIEFTRS